MDNVFTTKEYTVMTPCKCPTCGGEMSPAEYFVAEFGGSNSKVDNSLVGLGKVTTTTTTRYTNVRSQLGGFCKSCYTKKRQSVVKEYKILSIVLSVIVVICLLGFIGYLINRSNDEFAQKYAGIAFGTIVGALLTGFFALKNMMSGNQVKNSLKKINSPEDTKERSIYISAAYVFESKSLGFCQNNEVLLSKGDVEYMKLMSKQ